MNDVISVETACLSDANSIGALLRLVGLPSHGLEEHLDNFLVARKDGKVIGCVGLEVYGENCLLRSLAVHSEYRGKGIGVQLIKAIISRARGLRLNQAIILTNSIEPLAARFGFEKVARQSIDPRVAGSWEFQANCCQSAVCMRLYLV